MKFRFKIVIVIILAFIAWFIFKIAQVDKKVLNVVSSQSTELAAHQQPITKTNNPSDITNDITEQIELTIPLENEDIEDLRQMTYLDLYEQSLDLSDCYGYISRIDQSILGITEEDKEYENEIDFVEEYKKDIERYSQYRQQQASEKQLSAYNQNIKTCKTIIAKIEFLYDDEEMKGNKFYVITKIHELMKETKPKTDEEKELKFTIDKVSDLRKSFSELIELNKGKSQLNETELRDLEINIEKLKWEVLRLKQSPEGILDPQKLQEIEAKFESKKRYYSSLFKHDKQAQENKRKELLFIISELYQKLHSKYFRVFNEAFSGLNFSNIGVNTLPNFNILSRIKKTGVIIPVVSEQIFNKLQIKNKPYFNQLLQPSLDLYLCYLGQDCSFPLNHRLAGLCYLPPIEYFSSGIIYHEACEMDLEEFYLEYYFTQNQLEDLKVIFNYLVQTYAK